jgi:hypothetical protein
MSRYPKVTVEFGFQFNISMKAFPISLDIVGKWPTVDEHANHYSTDAVLNSNYWMVQVSKKR